MGRTRILHVSQPTAAGVALCVRQLVAHQVARGLDPVVACPAEGWLGDAVRAVGGTVVPWPAERSPGLSVPAETRSLQRIVDREAPDVVHLHSAKAGLAGRLAVRGSRPTAFHPNGWSFLVPGRSQRLACRWERVAVRWTDLFVFASQHEADLARATGIEGHSVVAHNGVDLDRFPYADDAARESARVELDLSRAPTAVCVGRLCDQKGQRALVDAWRTVRARLPDAQLVLVGDGPDRAAIESAAVDGVILAGERSDPERWLAAADVAVQPSAWEGMSFATLEALATGRPVVTYDVVGMQEAVGDAGAVVTAGRVDLLTAAVTARLTDAALGQHEGLVGRRRAEELFDNERFVTSVTAATLALVPMASTR